MASTGRSVEDLEADEYESINNALAYLDVLGIYYKNRYVRRQDVMEIWALPLVRLMQAAQPFLRHRDADQGSPIWPRLRALTTEAQLYLDRHHLTFARSPSLARRRNQLIRSKIRPIQDRPLPFGRWTIHRRPRLSRGVVSTSVSIRPVIEIRVDGWLYRVTDPQFELVIPFWEGMDPRTAPEADATINLPDGTRRYVSFMTLSGVAKIMNRWQESGECLNGRYFYCTDLVIINEPGFHEMADVIRDLIDTGDIAHACGLLEPDDDPDN